MIRKKDKFVAILKNSGRWRWGDVRWQTVPEAANGGTGNAQSPKMKSHVHRITSLSLS